MLDTSHSRASARSDASPHVYRVFLLTRDGAVVTVMRLNAGTDAEAIVQAKAFVDGRAVELWDGVRFIDHFPPFD